MHIFKLWASLGMSLCCASALAQYDPTSSLKAELPAGKGYQTRSYFGWLTVQEKLQESGDAVVERVMAAGLRFGPGDRKSVV